MSRLPSHILFAMLLGLHSPSRLSGQDLDHYLSIGWRPLGQQLYTSHFVVIPGTVNVHGVLCTRLPLLGFEFSKRRRRLLRQNRSRFRIETGPAIATREKTVLNDRYGQLFPDKHCVNLNYFILDHHGNRAMDTHEIRVYDQDLLVAFSFFDKGQTALYGKVGVYDPDYADFSLGLYTMLEEVALGAAQGFQYYYPGYVSPTVPDFDYKHKAGNLEYFDLRSGQWQPFSAFRPEDNLLTQMNQALRKLEQVLLDADMAAKTFLYPSFEIKLMGANPLPYLEHPVFLMSQAPSSHEPQPIAITFDPIEAVYELRWVVLMSDTPMRGAYDIRKTQMAVFDQAMVCTKPEYKTADTQKMAAFLARL